MKAATAAGTYAGLPDSGARRQACKGEAAVTAVSVGVGVTEALGAPVQRSSGEVADGSGLGFAGRVAGVFGAGFYVTGDDGALFAVLGPRSWPGPLHLVTASLPGLPAAGERVTAAGTTLAAGGLVIDLGAARLWEPTLPDGLDCYPTIWASTAPPVEPDLAPVWDGAAASVAVGDLASAFRLLEGRGGGLTPAGDDALAGIMLVAAADRSQRPALRRLARRARTGDLSRAFLEWAARGASIEPAHAVLEAAASGDRAGLTRAARTLTGVGATSGRALLAGLALAVAELPPRPAGPRLAPAAVSPSTATPDPASPRATGPRPRSVGSASASANRLTSPLRAGRSFV